MSSTPPSSPSVKAEADIHIRGRQDYYDPKSKKFFNPWPTWKDLGTGKKLKLLLKFMFLRTPKPNLPLHAPAWPRIRAPPRHRAQALWIGHATFLLQMRGLNILTDPVFSQRCSPVRFAGPSRMVPTPCAISELPKVDAVVISHNHYDHLDTNSIKQLEKHHQPTYFVPLGVGSQHLAKWNVPEDRIVERGWYESASFADTLEMVCVPVQHWSSRGLRDKNKSLWGGWVIRDVPTGGCVSADGGGSQSLEGEGSLTVTPSLNETLQQLEELEHASALETGLPTLAEDNLPGGRLSVFFCGDTGYCSEFVRIGREYGPFDLSMIPIGAYHPRDYFSWQHVDPEEAVQVHVDLQSRRSVGMHWGTFFLTFEPVEEPPVRLRSELESRDLSLDAFVALEHGQLILSAPKEEGVDYNLGMAEDGDELAMVEDEEDAVAGESSSQQEGIPIPLPLPNVGKSSL